MKLDVDDLFDRGTMTMQMEDIVDTLTPWQTFRLWLFCRQSRARRTIIAGQQWDRSEHVCEECEPRCLQCRSPRPLELA